MYDDFWGLSESPFRNTLDPRWFYESPIHEEALARLLFLVENNRRCGVISARMGVGKSLLLEILRSEATRSGASAARVDLCGLTSQEMLWEIASEWRLEIGRDDSLPRVWRKVSDHIASNRYAKSSLVLLLDHLDRAEPECTRVVERLLHLSAIGGTNLTLVLAVRPERRGPLAVSIDDWADLRVEIAPFDREQTREYIETLLCKAGAPENLFTADACERLFAESHGVPRALNRLCDLSLLAGMADDVEKIDESIVLKAAGELHSVGQSQPTTAQKKHPVAASV